MIDDSCFLSQFPLFYDCLPPKYGHEILLRMRVSFERAKFLCSLDDTYDVDIVSHPKGQQSHSLHILR